MKFRSENKRRPTADLDLTPLIDVIFLLLVFFLLTTTFSKPTQSREAVKEVEAAINVQLAKAKSGTSTTTAERITLFLDDKGQLFLSNGDQIAPNDLKAKLLELKEREENPLVDLKADRSASHGAVIEVLDLVKETGIEQVNIVIEKSEN